jgi:hypothetical protein
VAGDAAGDAFDAWSSTKKCATIEVGIMPSIVGMTLQARRTRKREAKRPKHCAPGVLEHLNNPKQVQNTPVGLALHAHTRVRKGRLRVNAST